MRYTVGHFTAAPIALALLAITCLSAPAAAGEPQVLDNAGLAQMLTNMGYEPTEGHFPDGNPFQEISGVASVMSWSANVSVNPVTNLIWLEMSFWSLNEDQKFPYDVLLEALERNFHLDTVRFMYVKGSRRLRLAGSIPNHDVRSADIRQIIEAAVNEARETQHLWNPNKWRQTATEDKPAKATEEDTAKAPGETRADQAAEQ
jgi:hypothetical protein